MYSFYLPQLETRTKDIEGLPNYIVKGYACIPNHVYTYKTSGNKSFKEFFSSKALENLKKKSKSQKVFADVEHNTWIKNSSELLLNKMKGQGFDKEIEHINTGINYSDIPMFKVEDINIDDNGLFVEMRGNPFYRSFDEEHKNRFDAVWNSLEKGFINGMSINFKPTKIIQTNSDTSQIDDLDLYGISLTGSPANEMATITEVAMRSIEHERGNKKWQMRMLLA